MKNVTTRWQGEKLWRIISFNEKLLRVLDEEPALLIYDFCAAIPLIFKANTNLKHTLDYKIELRYDPLLDECNKQLNNIFKSSEYKKYRDMVDGARLLNVKDAFEVLDYLKKSRLYDTINNKEV